MTVLRWKFAFSLAIVVNVALLVALGFAVLPKDAPAQPTRVTYRGILEGRVGGTEGSSLPPVASVLEGPPGREFATNTESTAPLERLVITSIGVDAPVVTLGLTPDGLAMASPEEPEVVAWYDFTSKPGVGGNATFSGHVDWAGYGPAVFARLRELAAGDATVAILADGTEISYKVSGSESYSLEDIPMAAILAPTLTDTLTLITCDGRFNSGSYSHRLVVRATRVGSLEAGQP